MQVVLRSVTPPALLGSCQGSARLDRCNVDAWYVETCPTRDQPGTDVFDYLERFYRRRRLDERRSQLQFEQNTISLGWRPLSRQQFMSAAPAKLLCSAGLFVHDGV
jgi:hypothetical protein